MITDYKIPRPAMLSISSQPAFAVAGVVTDTNHIAPQSLDRPFHRGRRLPSSSPQRRAQSWLVKL
ncbi:uncharacterized protein BDZ83DRAFT_622958 [Colletotrichum acutatum]|uniref:Uncharacterized protein n=1 Tax=Glomerella acutata TaxID=27357 RepID=A0AAD8UII2_GLOAC|nr:uncharacterized protein BDZ83DRAFT_622958 [Colletotrichum acutatum]KAK1724536.1 hypothetical protein BDZ83DRAFT_622958 [Colletotrichum acutatum]